MSKACIYTMRCTVTKPILFWAIFVLLCSCMTLFPSASEPASAAPSDDLSYIIYEIDSKQILAQRNISLPSDCSLLSRLMTSYIVLQEKSVTDIVVPVVNSVSTDFNYSLYVNREYTVDALVKAIVLANSDNAARALAYYYTPNTEYFVSLMNQKAAEFGMHDTYFTTVDGNSLDLQMTTSYDFALFMSNALRNTQLRNILGTDITHIWDGTMIMSRSKLVVDTDYSAIAKCGAFSPNYDTSKNLSTSAFYINIRNNGDTSPKKLVMIISGVTEDEYFELGTSLIEDAMRNYVKKEIVKANDVLLTIPVGSTELSLLALDSIVCAVPSDDESYIQTISYSYEKKYSPENISVPINEGAMIGTAHFLLKDGSLYNCTMVAGHSLVTRSDTVNEVIEFFNENRDIMILVLVLVCIEVLLLVIKIVSALNSYILKLIKDIKNRRT